ncbi:MAG: homoserine dehydrogenase, partial [Rhodospirillales bacterium]|nr:homoserine dehydrogenase [Rhodospirillales bacterium]
MNTPLKVAIAGLGTIGGGTIRLLRENADLLKRRCGRDLVVGAVCDLDKELAAEWPDVPYFDDALAMVR